MRNSCSGAIIPSRPTKTIAWVTRQSYKQQSGTELGLHQIGLGKGKNNDLA
jgi:hypothetical protein